MMISFMSDRVDVVFSLMEPYVPSTDFEIKKCIYPLIVNSYNKEKIFYLGYFAKLSKRRKLFNTEKLNVNSSVLEMGCF